MTEIIVVGFPKSGNTWLTRLLSAALDWPVRGVGEARPLAEQGSDRADGNLIRQLHLEPVAHGNNYPAIASQHVLNTDALNGHHKIVHIMRDPRDVAVSVNHYWGIGDLQRVITEVMTRGVHPLFGCGWSQYVSEWRAALMPVIETRYEWLHDNPLFELRRIIDRLELREVEPLDEVVRQEEINTRRTHIRKHGEQMAHGITPQLTNLRAGRVGDWRHEFTPENVAAFAEHFTPQLLKYGYEDDPEWHLAFVQTC